MFRKGSRVVGQIIVLSKFGSKKSYISCRLLLIITDPCTTIIILLQELSTSGICGLGIILTSFKEIDHCVSFFGLLNVFPIYLVENIWSFVCINFPYSCLQYFRKRAPILKGISHNLSWQVQFRCWINNIYLTFRCCDVLQK